MQNKVNDKQRFYHEFGCDGYKIIAAYEEACDIAHSDKFSSWFGDLAIFEASLNPNATYDKLCERYNAGLRFLGIVKEQSETICNEFTSSQLAEHIREEKRQYDDNNEYQPQSVLTKREVFEFSKGSLRVDSDIQLDDENKQQIVAYLETLFDVNNKFGLKLDSEAGEWVNMYGIYNPFSDFLTVECIISTDDNNDVFYYSPTKAEAELIKDMITQKIQEVHGQTPVEFCLDTGCAEEQIMGGM